MTYDPIDTNDDGVVDADVDNQSVSTENLNDADHFVATSDDLASELSDAGSGSLVALLPGLHTLPSSVQPSSENVTIRGYPGAVVAFPDGVTADYNLFRPSASGVEFLDLTFDLNADNTAPPNAHGNGSAIRFDGDGQTVRRCTFRNAHMRCVQSYQADNCTVEDSVFEDWAIEQNEPAVNADRGAEGWSVVGNLFDGRSGSSGPAFVADGTGVSASEHGVFRNVCRSVAAGRTISIKGVNAAGTVIGSNRLINSGGIFIEPANATAANNWIKFPSEKGIFLNGESISRGNTVIGAVNNYPIHVLEGSSEGDRVVGGSQHVYVSGEFAEANDLSALQVHGSPLKLEASNTAGSVKSTQKDKSTTLAASASAGDSQIELSANSFIEGERIEIGGTETHFVQQIIDDDAFGSANIVELDDTLGSSYSSGASVATSLDTDHLWVDEFGNGYGGIVAEADMSNGGIVSTGVDWVKANGIIGGGRIGGNDIGSLTGPEEGDLARADGTTATANEVFIRLANGDWQSLADPTNVITPTG